MKSISRVLMLTIPLAFALSAHADTQHDLNEAGFWLEAKSQQLVRQSRATMSDGTSGFEPAASGYYPAFWTRDYAYMVEGCPEAFTNTELTNACLTLVNAIGPYNGVANTAVECIKPDGTVYHKPGWDTMGVNATADNSQFTVDIAWRTYQQTGDTALVNQTINKLVATMNSVPRSANGLVYIDPTQAWDRCPYGFTDSVKKTGNELYCSLLDVRASNELADLLTVAGRTTDAATWRASAAAKTTAIQTTFWNPSYTASNPGLFYAATVKCNQFDVWGSALAVQLGVATPDQAASIANYFNNNYSTMVLSGQVREIPTPLYWQDSVCGQGTNQNGGYWGVATGQFAAALKAPIAAKSQQTLLDMVNFYKTTQCGAGKSRHRQRSGRRRVLRDERHAPLGRIQAVHDCEAGVEIDGREFDRRKGRRLGQQRRHGFRQGLHHRFLGTLDRASERRHLWQQQQLDRQQPIEFCRSGLQ